MPTASLAKEQHRPLRVFLCHSSGDKAAVRDLCHRLRADGFEPWFDEQCLIPGQDWREEIPKAVHNSDAVVVCLSCGSINKEGYLQKEIKYALDVADEKPEGTIFIIPAKLEECAVPSRLSRWEWANLYEPTGYGRLLLALAERARSVQARIPAMPDHAVELRWRMKAMIVSGIVVALALSAWFVSRPQAGGSTPSSLSPARVDPPTDVIKLRSEPALLSGAKARAMVSLRDFYCKSWNEAGKGIKHRYAARVAGEAVMVADAATGLMWQQSGSGDAVSVEGAQGYVRSMNERKFGGFANWRLPTLEEAMSLMTTEQGGVPGEAMVGDTNEKGRMHLDRSFDQQAAPFIWTSDTAPENRHWIVYYWDGECQPESHEFNSYVRVVRPM